MLIHHWLGSATMYLDTANVAACGDMLIGCYGGNRRAGARKNEDGALTLCAEDGSWHFAALCDAHVTSQSAELLLSTLAAAQADIVGALEESAQIALPALHNFLVEMLASDDFRAKCRAVRGETACLICVQKDQWLWWLSIGDCVLYLFHPELAHLGQYALNQRNFYEWIGQVNTFDLAIPCYTTGVRELRQGRNDILLVTDGLLECGTRPFEDPRALYALMTDVVDGEEMTAWARISTALARVHAEAGRDSATVIHWCYDNPVPGFYPTG